jgi:hypothetical protein
LNLYHSSFRAKSVAVSNRPAIFRNKLKFRERLLWVEIRGKVTEYLIYQETPDISGIQFVSILAGITQQRQAELLFQHPADGLPGQVKT